MSSVLESLSFIKDEEDYEEVDGRVEKVFKAPEYGDPDVFKKLTREKMELNVIVYDKRLDEETKVSIVPMYGRLSYGEIIDVRPLNRERNESPDLPPLVFEEEAEADIIEDNWLNKPSYIDYDDTDSRKVEKTGKLLFNDVNKVALRSKNTLFPLIGGNFRNIVKNLYERGLEKRANGKKEENKMWDYSEMPDLVCGDDEVDEENKYQEMEFEQRTVNIAKRDVRKVLKTLKSIYENHGAEVKQVKKQRTNDNYEEVEKNLKELLKPNAAANVKDEKSTNKKEDLKPALTQKSAPQPSLVKTSTKASAASQKPETKPEKETKKQEEKTKVAMPTTPQKEEIKQDLSRETDKKPTSSQMADTKQDPKKKEDAKSTTPVAPPQKIESKRESEEKSKKQEEKASTTPTKREEQPAQQKSQKKEVVPQKDKPVPEKKADDSRTAAIPSTQSKEKTKKKNEEKPSPVAKEEIKRQQPEKKKEQVKEVVFKPIATNREHMKRCGSHECKQSWINEENEDRVLLTCTCKCRIILHVKCSKSNDAVKIIEDPNSDKKAGIPCPTPSCSGKIARIDYLYSKDSKVESKTIVFIKPKPKKQQQPKKKKEKKPNPPPTSPSASQGPKVSEKKPQPKEENNEKKKVAEPAEKKKGPEETTTELPEKKDETKKKEVPKKQERESLPKQDSGKKVEPLDAKKRPQQEDTKKGVITKTDPIKKKTEQEQPQIQKESDKKKEETGKSVRKNAGVIGIEETLSKEELIVQIQPKNGYPAGTNAEAMNVQNGNTSKKASKKEKAKKQKGFQQTTPSSETDKKDPPKQVQQPVTNDWIKPDIVQKIKGVIPTSGVPSSSGKKDATVSQKRSSSPTSTKNVPQKTKGEEKKLKTEKVSELQASPQGPKKGKEENRAKAKTNFGLEIPFPPFDSRRLDIFVGKTLLCSVNMNETPNKSTTDFVYVSQFGSNLFI